MSYSTILTNYFKVKDTQNFKKWIAQFSYFQVSITKDCENYVKFYATECDGIPCSKYNEETDEDVDIEFLNELSEHLEVGEVVILQECGTDKMRTMTARSVVLDWEGKQKWFDLNDSHFWAKEKYGESVVSDIYQLSNKFEVGDLKFEDDES